MGLTLLAAGTSIPDTVASVLVARKGKTGGLPDALAGPLSLITIRQVKVNNTSSVAYFEEKRSDSREAFSF